MATATVAPARTEPASEVPYLFTSDDFESMIDRGVLSQERRVYLWDGRLYEKMPKSSEHSAVQMAFNKLLTKRLEGPYTVGAENPVRLDSTHVPLPDLIVVKGEP